MTTLAQPAPAPAKFLPTPQQMAIYQRISALDGGNLVIDAKAGSGKTTTLVQAMKYLSPNARVIFLAFNRVIAEELRAKLPSFATAATFHSACRRAVLGHFPVGAKRAGYVDLKKSYKLLDKLVADGEVTHDIARDLGPTAIKLLGFARQIGIGCLVEDVPGEWHGMVARWEVEANKPLDLRTRLGGLFSPVFDCADRRAYWEMDQTGKSLAIDCSIELARRLLVLDVESAGDLIDFDDMLYLPIRLGIPLPRYDFVFVDEAQDTNAIQRAILHQLVGQTGRLIAVGDYRQAIYAFRGADCDALPTIEREFGCATLPLSVSWRCPLSVIREAQKIVPDIEPAPNAIEGTVEWRGLASRQTFAADDLILCRNTAPLVALAFSLLKQGQPCKILGQEIGEGLTKLIDRMRAANVEMLFEKLDLWFAKESVKLAGLGDETKIEAMADKIEVIRIAADRLGDRATIEGIKFEIVRLFDDSNRAVLTLSTIHRSKGLEYDHVWFLDQHLLPSKYAKRPAQLEQEANLRYVAVTRSKNTLSYIDSPPRKRRDED